MRRFLICLFLLLPVFILFGCKKKSVVRYQLVAIPQYEQKNYEKLLDSGNTEVKYNAICNLIDMASGYARDLNCEISEKKPDCKSQVDKQTYESARRVYSLITANLTGRDENLKTASLIFLSEFATGYDHKDELYNIISKVNAKDAKTQYEHLNALMAVCDNNTEGTPDVIEKYLNSDSWLIKSMTYVLLSKTKSIAYHKRLIREYKQADEDYNKLLILQGFGQNYGPEVYAFIAQELLTTTDDMLKRQLAVNLKNCDDPAAAAQWVVLNQKNLGCETINHIITEYSSELENARGTVFFKTLMASSDGKILKSLDNPLLFSRLYGALGKKPQDEALLFIEKFLLDVPDVGESLRQYKTQTVRDEFVKTVSDRELKHTAQIFMPEFIDLSDRYFQVLKASLIDAGLNETEMEKSIKEYKEFVSDMKKSIEKQEEENNN